MENGFKEEDVEKSLKKEYPNYNPINAQINKKHCLMCGKESTGEVCSIQCQNKWKDKYLLNNHAFFNLIIGICAILLISGFGFYLFLIYDGRLNQSINQSVDVNPLFNSTTENSYEFKPSFNPNTDNKYYNNINISLEIDEDLLDRLCNSS